MRKLFTSICLLCFFCCHAQTKDTSLWHNRQRALRYHPEGEDIVITNGNRRFTRALYGTNTAFRVEAGDLPELALYMPGMGGNIKFGLVSGNQSKWLINADKIVARYRAGSMLYEIEDTMLGKGKLHISVLALADAEGVIIKIASEGNVSGAQLLWAYGGATGKKFSRDGDMGPDPESSFYLKPEYCTDNRYALFKDHFIIRYGTGEILSEEDRYENKNLPGEKIKPQKGKEQMIAGIFPANTAIHIGDAAKQNSPAELYASAISVTPAVTGRMDLGAQASYFFCFTKTDSAKQNALADLSVRFDEAEIARKKIAGRIKINTPDPYINTLGGALAIAADAIWETPSYLHGSIGWRMRLNGWRGAYAGDVLGWHDRAKMHFRSYASSQVTAPDSGKIISDTALHLARQLEKMGTSLFSNGYISRNPGGDQRPHHYDMNLVFIDGLLWHFKWAGDTAFIKEMWPVIKRHLAWEKRNFDPDNNGLYDAYASIWASDALQYSGGSVTHSSAYNFRANKIAAELAVIVGADPAPFTKEAAKIKKAVDNILWMKSEGHYAEYKDALGLQSLHPNAGLWTIYHSIDSDLPDAFKSYQLMKYVDEHIPHIPIKAAGLPDGYYTLSTSNWMPYSWSLNNVALAELMHTSLADWEAGRNNTAFALWKSSLLESMYLGGSPGNFQQISTYDAIRGEAYRDFADPVGMTARSLVQGLFGILPDALKSELTLKPGFPSDWNNASIQTPDLKFNFKRNGQRDNYTIVPSLPKKMTLALLLKARAVDIETVLINGKRTAWQNIQDAVGEPMIKIKTGIAEAYEISIEWKGQRPDSVSLQKVQVTGSGSIFKFPHAVIKSVYDPQNITIKNKIEQHEIKLAFADQEKTGTIFLQVGQGNLTWWQPVSVKLVNAVEIGADLELENGNGLVSIHNQSPETISGFVMVNKRRQALDAIQIPSFGTVRIKISQDLLATGSNEIGFVWNGKQIKKLFVNWNAAAISGTKMDMVDLGAYFNDKVTSIFRNQYLSPRPSTVTLQLPTQGIGEWTHPLLTADINDSGLRKIVANTNTLVLPQNLCFQTPADTMKSNILFTSQWNNYPKEIAVPLSGKSSHAYFLMAGSTNPMQSRMVNGIIAVFYTDGSSDTLQLKNPETWWPIEQDYFEDGFAFHNAAPKPIRVHLKTGKVILPDNDLYNGKMIDGGAATVLDLVLNPSKTLKELKLKTLSNDVVIGLMAVTMVN
jgi:hypothetical protein